MQREISLSPNQYFYEIKDMVTQRYCVFDQNYKDVEQMIQQNQMGWSEGILLLYPLGEQRRKLKAGPELACEPGWRLAGDPTLVEWFCLACEPHLGCELARPWLCWFYSLRSLIFHGSGLSGWLCFAFEVLAFSICSSGQRVGSHLAAFVGGDEVL